jgi:hypothetical protein
MSGSPKRLIEVNFPLREVSEQSVREKNIRHGHISTLHIWWARRPLAASRATALAALLPDPGDDAKRKELLELVRDIAPWEVVSKDTPQNRALLERARKLILEANGGKPPKVLDCFAGGAEGVRRAGEVQRCQLHRRRKVKARLPRGCCADDERQLRNGHAMASYEEAKAALGKCSGNWSASTPAPHGGLEEGIEETLTLHRLGVGSLLRRSLSTTNILESCVSTVRHMVRNVKRWQGGDHIARRTAAGMREAEKKFRKMKGYRELRELAES